MARSRARPRSAALRRRSAAPGTARCGCAVPARRRALPRRRSGRRRSPSEAGDPGERQGGGFPQHSGQRLPGPRRAARGSLGLSPRHPAQAGLRGGVQRPRHRVLRARRSLARRAELSPRHRAAARPCSRLRQPRRCVSQARYAARGSPRLAARAGSAAAQFLSAEEAPSVIGRTGARGAASRQPGACLAHRPPRPRAGCEQPRSRGASRRGIARGWIGGGGHRLREARGRAASRRCAVAGTARRLAARGGLAAIGAAAPGAMGASAAALTALARVLREQGETSAAVARLEQALRLEPQGAQALQLIGESLRYENKIEEAERRFREGLKVNPESIPLLGDLAQVLGDQMRYAEAFACIEKALARVPDEPLILATKGILQDLTGQEAEAESLLRAALQAAPENVDIGHSLAILRLRHGHFEEGWQGLELRRRKEYFVGRYRRFPFAEWQGEPLAGKSILVYPEQGLGDEIMYGSCIPELVARARHVAVECDHKLGALFARSFPGCTVTARLRTMANDWVNHLEPRPDYQVPMGSLPLHFRRRVEDFPRHGGYLAPDERKVAAWKRRLDALGPGPKVGLSWQGGVGHTGRARRSLTLEQLLPLLRLAGVHFVSLQYTEVDDEIRNLAARHGITVHHWQGAIDVYDETAALVCALDRVVTVCTALVHLTGALGRPAIVMVPFGSDWRYGAQGERMPWYPSVRLIRQRAIGDWPPVIEAVRGLLQG